MHISPATELGNARLYIINIDVCVANSSGPKPLYIHIYTNLAIVPSCIVQALT